MITKRTLFHVACGAGSAVTVSRSWGASIAAETLRGAARAAGLHFGTADDVALAKAPDYAALIVNECDLYAPNMSWHRISPRPGTYDFSVCQANIDFTVSRGLRLTGYHLVWHLVAPEWFKAIDNRDDAEKVIADYIAAVGARYGKSTYSWNVVNEAIKPTDGRDDGLRQTTFLTTIGPEFIDFAFRLAHQAAPQVMRVYNDYDLELAVPEHEAKRTALFKLLDRLQRGNCPIDAIGLQCHLKSAQFASFNSELYQRFLHEIAARKLKILITELDVFDTSTKAIPARDAEIAAVYKTFLSVALDETAVVAVSTWGLGDDYTWLNPTYSRNFSRPDGSPTRPLPFGSDLAPKPAFNAIVEALNAAPRR